MDTGAFTKRGFMPLALGRHASIAWRGEVLRDFWMWNGQFMEEPGKARKMQTVRVRELKEAALRYWRDGWVPLRWDQATLRSMEAALRAHRGLAAEGVSFPDEAFLAAPELPREAGAQGAGA